MAAGDFSASTLSTVIEKQEALFQDPRNARLYEPKAEALREMLRMQTANVSLLNTSAQNKVKIAFVDTSAITTLASCTDECQPTGTLLETKAQEFTLTQCTEATPFRVEVPLGSEPDSAYANGVYGLSDAVAAGMLKQEKEIIEKVAAGSVSLTAGKAGVNQDPAPEYGAVIAGTNTTIPAANWNANIFPFFQLEAELNRFGMPYMLHGRNLYLEKLNAVPNAQNDDQRDQQAKYELIESAWDPFTFNRAGLNGISLMIDAGAIAFGSRNEYGTAPVEAEANVRVFSVQSRFIPGLRMDVKKIRMCVAGKYYDTYTMKLPYWDIIQNPANGIAGDTGVLKFTKGA